MDIWLTSGILSLSAIFYALIALPVAVMTLMSGHSFSLSSARTKLRKLTKSFIFGNVFMLGLSISTLFLIVERVTPYSLNAEIYLGVAVMILIEAVILTLYSYKSLEAQPWISEVYKSFLYKRATKTNSPAEAFGLGLSAVTGQFTLFLVPFIAVSLAMINLSNSSLLFTISSYCLVLISPLIITSHIIRKRNSIRDIHKFIIAEHKFLQVAASLTLVVLAIFIIGNLESF